MADAAPPLSTVSGRQLLAVVIACGLGVVTAYWALPPLLTRTGGDPAHLRLAVDAAAYFGVVAMVWLAAVRAKGWSAVGLRRCDPSLLWNGGFLAFVWIGVSSALYAAVGIWEIAIAYGVQMIAPYREDEAALVALFVLAGPIAALVEELLFRGIVYGWLRQRLNIAISAVLSALVFAAAHIGVFAAGPAAIIDMTVLAILLALLFEVSRSLWPGILCHALYNMLLLSLYLYRS